MDEILLPYGERPYALGLSGREAVVSPPKSPAARPLPPLLERALDRPIGVERLECLRPRPRRAILIISDDTRADPRRALVDAAIGRLGDVPEIAIAVASGTHGPCDPNALGLGDEILRRYPLIQHDAGDESALVTLGTTRRGTPVRIHRSLLEADLVIATGQIRPHYFAGYGAGAKAIFPGLGGRREIRKNHELKSEAGARPGEIDANPCRLDLEEAAAMLPAQSYLLNAIADAGGGHQGAVAGDLRAAFREGARLCAPLFTVRAPASRAVVVSDRLPITGSLYQASKLVAAAAPLVEDGGTVIVAAQCPRGIGPIRTVNHGIYELGIKNRLPTAHRVVLVSDLPPSEVRTTYCEPAERVEDILQAFSERPVIIPRAGSLILVRDD